jgi:Ca2+-binding EF-hand superfamily protein
MEAATKVFSRLGALVTGQDIETQAQIEGNEKVEYLRLMTEFPPEEIVRLQQHYQKITNDAATMTLEQFVAIEAIERNPLKWRIADVFGFEAAGGALTCDAFICGLAQFNSPGKRDEKLRLMFRLHDIDGDGALSPEDIVGYLTLISSNGQVDGQDGDGGGDQQKQLDVIVEAVANLFDEFDRSARRKGLSMSDFNLVVGPTDFHTKLFIPI